MFFIYDIVPWFFVPLAVCPSRSRSILRTMLKHLPGSLVLLIFSSLLLTGGEDVPIILNGLINQSILMSLPGDLSRPVLLASWNFKTNQMATYTNQLIVHVDQFEGRLETLNNGRTLRIGQLRLEDSGMYLGTITFTDKTRDRRLYNLSVYGEVVPIRVNGLINQSVLLSPSVDTSRPVQYVYWNFQSHIMASFINSQLTVIRNEFEGRLEILDDGRALRIGQLTLNDSGLYSVTMTFMDKTKLEASYNLTVYEPVPTPSIRFESMEKTSDWCNVTLQCSIPRNTSSLFYTWKYRHGDQLYYDPGDTVQMSLQPESWDMEVLCIVLNPVDQKNVSVAKFCTNHSGKHRRTEKGTLTCQLKLYIYLPILTILSLLLLLLCLLNRSKTRRKTVT